MLLTPDTQLLSQAVCQVHLETQPLKCPAPQSSGTQQLVIKAGLMGTWLPFESFWSILSEDGGGAWKVAGPVLISGED